MICSDLFKGVEKEYINLSLYIPSIPSLLIFFVCSVSSIIASIVDFAVSLYIYDICCTLF